MMGFPRQAFFLLLVISLGVFFVSVHWCDGQRIIGANSIKIMFSCEDNIMHLTCPHRSLSVEIVSAKYGRLLSNKNICPKSSDRHVIKDCGESNVQPTIGQLCAGKTECSFSVDNRILGAFCVNIYKYITVVYKCVIKPTTEEPPTTTPMPTTEPKTTLPPLLTETAEPSSDLFTTNATSNSTSENSSTEPKNHTFITLEPIEATQRATRVPPRTKKPVIEVYERDVFSRRNGGVSNVLSGFHSMSKFAVTLLVFVVFDAYIFRVT